MTKLARIVGVVLLTIGAARLVPAAVGVPAPEIDPGAGMNALALLAGAVLVIRSGRKK